MSLSLSLHVHTFDPGVQNLLDASNLLDGAFEGRAVSSHVADHKPSLQALLRLLDAIYVTQIQRDRFPHKDAFVVLQYKNGMLRVILIATEDEDDIDIIGGAQLSCILGDPGYVGTGTWDLGLAVLESSRGYVAQIRDAEVIQ
jgi:hypothetical protein